MHCHLREPGYEYKETIKTGTDSAINGGYTAICPMANTNPVNDNIETLKFIKEKSENYNLFPICATTKNLLGEELTNIKELKNGIRVVTEKIDYVESVSFGVWVKQGAVDELPEVSKFYNEYWVYPSSEETPQNKGRVEGGCYW